MPIKDNIILEFEALTSNFDASISRSITLLESYITITDNSIKALQQLRTEHSKGSKEYQLASKRIEQLTKSRRNLDKIARDEIKQGENIIDVLKEQTKAYEEIINDINPNLAKTQQLVVDAILDSANAADTAQEKLRIFKEASEEYIQVLNEEAAAERNARAEAEARTQQRQADFDLRREQGVPIIQGEASADFLRQAEQVNEATDSVRFYKTQLRALANDFSILGINVFDVFGKIKELGKIFIVGGRLLASYTNLTISQRKALIEMNQAMGRDAVRAAARFRAAMNVVRTALASTGILAVVAALASLVTFFTTFTEGANSLSDALGGIRQIFIEIGTLLGDIGKALTNPLTALKEIGEAIDRFQERISDAFSRGSETNENIRLFNSQIRELEKSIGRLENRIKRVNAETFAPFNDDFANQEERLRRTSALQIDIATKRFLIEKKQLQILQEEVDKYSAESVKGAEFRKQAAEQEVAVRGAALDVLITEQEAQKQINDLLVARAAALDELKESYKDLRLEITLADESISGSDKILAGFDRQVEQLRKRYTGIIKNIRDQFPPTIATVLSLPFLQLFEEQFKVLKENTEKQQDDLQKNINTRIRNLSFRVDQEELDSEFEKLKKTLVKAQFDLADERDAFLDALDLNPQDPQYQEAEAYFNRLKAAFKRSAKEARELGAEAKSLIFDVAAVYEEFGKSRRTDADFRRLSEGLFDAQIESQIESLKIQQDNLNEAAKGYADAYADLENQINALEAQVAQEERRREERRRQERQKAFKETIAAYVNLSDQILRELVRRTNLEIQIQQRRVARAKRVAEDGNAEQLQLEEERLDKLLNQRERYLQRQRQLAAIENAINQTIAISNAIRAISEGGANPLIVALNVAAIVAGIGAAVLAINNAFGDIPQFYAGTEGTVQDALGYKAGIDSHVVRVDNKERILNPSISKQLQGIKSSDIPGLVERGLSYERLGDLSNRTIMSGNGDASAQEIVKLRKQNVKIERKLDEVVGALSSIQVTQKVDRDGVYNMVKMAMRKENTKDSFRK